MNTVKQLVETIKEGIQEKKGQDIVIADLTEIDGSIAKYFIICQGGSPTQVEAIAGSVGDIVRKKTTFFCTAFLISAAEIGLSKMVKSINR